MRLQERSLSTERKIAVSPVWVRLVDTFTKRGPSGRIEMRIEARQGNQWREVTTPYLLKKNGDLAFINLGRAAPGEAGQQFDLRVSAAVDGCITEAANGTPLVVLNVTTWTVNALPPPPEVQEIRCYPAPDYRHAPETPLLSGRVERAGDPVRRARVRSRTRVSGNTLTEEVRTDEEGWFRLPLRWSSGATRIDADRFGATGSKTINVPDDLDSVFGITIS